MNKVAAILLGFIPFLIFSGCSVAVNNQITELHVLRYEFPKTTFAATIAPIPGSPGEYKVVKPQREVYVRQIAEGAQSNSWRWDWGNCIFYSAVCFFGASIITTLCYAEEVEFCKHRLLPNAEYAFLSVGLTGVVTFLSMSFNWMGGWPLGLLAAFWVIVLCSGGLGDDRPIPLD